MNGVLEKRDKLSQNGVWVGKVAAGRRPIAYDRQSEVIENVC